MMEASFTIKFTSPEADIEFWAQLAKGLCNDKRGAWLEEQFDRFGDKAASLITSIMNECERQSNAGGHAIMFDTWKRNKNRFYVTANGGWILEDLLPLMRELLLSCGVQNLVLEDPEWEY
jgi:hypothetical protein